MFGEITAIFTPRYVRNMTLIAPIDTGAWEGECNRSMGQGFQRATDDKTCAAVTKESGCNGEDQANPGKFIMCDWRKTTNSKGGDSPVCVNSALDRQQCYHAKDAASCKIAPGLPAANDNSPHQSLSHLWAEELRNGGCSWDKSECVAFTCDTLVTQAACHLAAHPPPPNCSQPGACRDQHYEMPKHCTWDKSKSVCAHTNPAQYCEAQMHPDKPPGGGGIGPSPPPLGPPPPPYELCTEGEGLCMWEGKNGNQTATQGKCIPTHCDKIKKETICSEKNEGYGISCAWVNSTADDVFFDDDAVVLDLDWKAHGKCITFNENCTLLPTEESCNHMDACSWNHTGKDHSGPKVCVGGAPKPPMGGWEFNCSNTAWFGIDEPLSPIAGAGLKGEGPGALTLGTPEHHYHTLAAGVSVWNETDPASQLGVMVRRMAEPYHTNISSSEIFKYWEANIAGAPPFPAGVKMLVGSFSKLFGTDDGRRLQAWCKKEGWVLAWALGSVGADTPPGSNGGGGGSPYSKYEAPFSNRSLDLEVLPHTTAAHNLSVSHEHRADFSKLWHGVARVLNASKQMPEPTPMPPSEHGTKPNGSKNHSHQPLPPGPGPQINNSEWRKLWSKLPHVGKIGFLGGGSCAGKCFSYLSSAGMFYDPLILGLAAVQISTAAWVC